MLIWCLLLSLVVSGSFYGLGLNPTTFHDVDFVFFTIAIAIISVSYLASPWREITEIRHQQETVLTETGVDLSSPYALAKGLASSGGTFAVARVADATGFGVFMASAKALGAMGMSFTGIHQSMSILGFLLHPGVYVAVSLSLGIVTVLSNIKTGDQFLKKAVAAIYFKEWQKAYDFARQAADKRGLLKASQEKVSSWEYYLEYSIWNRERELKRLANLCEKITANPRLFGFKGFLLGVVFSAPIVWFGLSRGANGFSTGAVVFAISLLVSERYFSLPMARILTRTPVLQSELTVLAQIRKVVFLYVEKTSSATSERTLPNRPLDLRAPFQKLDNIVVVQVVVALFCAGLLIYVIAGT